MCDPRLATLIESARGGDNVALGELIQMYELRIRSYVQGKGLQLTDIEDVTQEVFCDLIRNRNNMEVRDLSSLL